MLLEALYRSDFVLTRRIGERMIGTGWNRQVFNSQKERGKTMGNEMTWRKAVEEILSKTPEAIHYKDVADEIVAKRLRRHVGATPAATVS